GRTRAAARRTLTARLLTAPRPPGYLTEARSHNAVAAAVAQGRADWGVAIASVLALAQPDEPPLGFLPLQEEHYDFAVPRARWDRPAVQAFRAVLDSATTREILHARGFRS